MRQTLGSGDYPHFFFVEKGNTLEIMFYVMFPEIWIFFENISVILENGKINLVFSKSWKIYMSNFPKIWKKIRVIFSKEKDKILWLVEYTDMQKTA